ncbi:MAG: hypothetical protein Q9162_004310 [Coniocarpon cinnabarinum]
MHANTEQSNSGSSQIREAAAEAQSQRQLESQSQRGPVPEGFARNVQDLPERWWSAGVSSGQDSSEQSIPAIYTPKQIFLYDQMTHPGSLRNVLGSFWLPRLQNARVYGYALVSREQRLVLKRVPGREYTVPGKAAYITSPMKEERLQQHYANLSLKRCSIHIDTRPPIEGWTFVLAETHD